MIVRKVQPVCWMNVELAAVMCTVFKHTHEVFCNMRDECMGEQEKLRARRLPVRKDIEYEINGEQGRDNTSQS